MQTWRWNDGKTVERVSTVSAVVRCAAVVDANRALLWEGAAANAMVEHRAVL